MCETGDGANRHPFFFFLVLLYSPTRTPLGAMKISGSIVNCRKKKVLPQIILVDR
jgi:hypothetical protein